MAAATTSGPQAAGVSLPLPLPLPFPLPLPHLLLVVLLAAAGPAPAGGSSIKTDPECAAVAGACFVGVLAPGTYLVCGRGGGLTSVPATLACLDLSAPVYWIQLAGGHNLGAVTAIPAPRLVVLILTSCSITSLAPGVLDGKPGLRTVTLDDNPLEAVPAGLFGNARALSELSIVSTGLVTIADNAFANCTALSFFHGYDNYLGTLTRDTLAGLTGLRFLDLEFNILTAVSAGAFRDLGMLEVLLLRGNALSTAPAGLLQGLGELRACDLSLNDLATIEPGAFVGAGKLQEMFLRDNRLTALRTGMLRGLGSLTDLTFSSNPIAAIEPGTFAGLTRVGRLNLRNTVLEALEPGTFDGLTALVTLLVPGGHLTSMHPQAFRDLGQLVLLFLNDNRLPSLGANAFAALSSLQELHLDGNNITVPAPGAFAGLGELRVLHLEENELSSLSAAWLSGMPSLTDLFLGDQAIAEVADLTFLNLPSLRLLDLANNRLTSLARQTLRGLDRTLVALSLRGNRIRRIEVGALVDVERLSRLDMAGNPSACTTLNALSPWSFWSDVQCACAPGFGGADFCEALEDTPCSPGSIQTSSAPRVCTPCPPGSFVPLGTVAESCASFQCPVGSVDEDGDSSTPCVPCGPNQYVPANSTLPCGSAVFACPSGTLDHDQRASTPCAPICSACRCDLNLDTRLTLDLGFGVGFSASVDCSEMGLTEIPLGLESLEVVGKPIERLSLAKNFLTALDLDRLTPLAANLTLLDVSRNTISAWPRDVVSFFENRGPLAAARGGRGVLLFSDFNPSECAVADVAQPAASCLCDARLTGDGTFCELTFDDAASSGCPSSYTDHDSNNATACRYCLSGFFLPAGSYGPCSDFSCETGTLDHDRNAGTPCVPCLPGNFCPRGSFLGLDTRCPPGTVDADLNAATACLPCRPGTGVPAAASVGLCDAYTCPLGFTDHDANPASACVSCGAGHFVPVGSAGPCALYACAAEGLTDSDGSAETPCVDLAAASRARESLNSSTTAALSLVGAVLIAAVLVLGAIFIRHRRQGRAKRVALRQQVDRLKRRVSEQFKELDFGASPTDSLRIEREFHELEVHRDEVLIQREVGSGAFGVVSLGELYLGRGRKQRCAIKQLRWAGEGRGEEGEEEAAAFLLEARLMASLRHLNIVDVLAVCTDTAPLLLVVEYMENGDLRAYMSERKERRDPLGVEEGVQACLSICSAMDFLESRKIVHRDLAARNILVGKDLGEVKLSDFGMSRTLTETEYYRKAAGTEKVPVKWMAPEAISDRKYTSKGDVWSYGVTIWELYSYGRAPYRGFNAIETTMKVAMGHRLSRPSGCPKPMFSVMKACWTLNPADRPSFSALFQRLAGMYQSSFGRQASFDPAEWEDSRGSPLLRPRYAGQADLLQMLEDSNGPHTSAATNTDYVELVCDSNLDDLTSAPPVAETRLPAVVIHVDEHRSESPPPPSSPVGVYDEPNVAEARVAPEYAEATAMETHGTRQQLQQQQPETRSEVQAEAEAWAQQRDQAGERAVRDAARATPGSHVPRRKLFDL